jgi:hypothetical protein
MKPLVTILAGTAVVGFSGLAYTAAQAGDRALPTIREVYETSSANGNQELTGWAIQGMCMGNGTYTATVGSKRVSEGRKRRLSRDEKGVVSVVEKGEYRTIEEWLGDSPENSRVPNLQQYSATILALAGIQANGSPEQQALAKVVIQELREDAQRNGGIVLRTKLAYNHDGGTVDTVQHYGGSTSEIEVAGNQALNEVMGTQKVRVPTLFGYCEEDFPRPEIAIPAIYDAWRSVFTGTPRLVVNSTDEPGSGVITVSQAGRGGPVTISGLSTLESQVAARPIVLVGGSSSGN